MAEQFRYTPTDTLTGLPLLFAPDPNLPPLPTKKGEVPPKVADLNHAMHPRTDPLLAPNAASVTPSAGPATRECRVQWVARPTHERYHCEFDGPPLPNTTERQFFTCTLAAAGYIPEQALDFSGKHTTIVTLTNRARELLRCSGQVRMMRPETVRRFLLEYVFANGAEHVSPRLVNEFIGLGISGKRPERQDELMHNLLTALIEPVIDPILLDTYQYARRNRLLVPRAGRSPIACVKRQITRGDAAPASAIGELVSRFVRLREGGPVPAPAR